MRKFYEFMQLILPMIVLAGCGWGLSAAVESGNWRNIVLFALTTITIVAFIVVPATKELRR